PSAPACPHRPNASGTGPPANQHRPKREPAPPHPPIRTGPNASPHRPGRPALTKPRLTPPGDVR
ncbi:MAG TPA: hypothetical protein VGD71_13055, partial [Kribbella sp.]